MGQSRQGRIRPLVEDDLGAALDILNFEIRTGPSNFHWEARPFDELLREWKGAEQRYPWLVFEEQGQVLGYAKAGAFRPKQAYDWTAEVTIYLSQAAQGRGIGKALYLALMGSLSDLGFHLAIGAITQPNEASEALHSTLGFELVGVLKEVGWKTGEWHDVAYWSKKLGDGPADERLLP